MPFNINEFRAELDKGKLYNPSNFVVSITQGSLDFQDLRFRCKSVNLPGRDVATSEEKFQGPMRKIAFESIYPDLNITIICSEDLREKDMMESWMDKILGPNRTIENTATNMFNLGFYKDYIGRVQIDNYTETNEKIYSDVYEEAYPISIGDIGLSWDNGNEIAVLPVTFYYRYFKTLKDNNAT